MSMVATSAIPEVTVSARVARGVLEVAEQLGIRRLELLQAAGLEPAELEATEARIPISRVFLLCELAMDLTHDPALGLHWSERLSEGTFAPISHLIAHAASLRQCFESLNQFYRLVGDQPGYQVLEHDRLVTVRVTRLAGDSARMQRFSAEMMVAGFFRLIRDFGVAARPERVSFEYPAPAYQSEYTRVFDQEVFFEQPFTGIVFDRALLDSPAPHKDDEVHEALRMLAEQRLLRLTQRTPYAQRVHDFLVREGWKRGADMKTVAQALGLSVRSLYRCLAAEGKAYDVLSNEARGVVAMRLVRTTQHTIQEIAFEMGFADPRSFHRAFKRWTGTTPKAYREHDVS